MNYADVTNLLFLQSFIEWQRRFVRYVNLIDSSCPMFLGVSSSWYVEWDNLESRHMKPRGLNNITQNVFCNSNSSFGPAFVHRRDNSEATKPESRRMWVGSGRRTGEGWPLAVDPRNTRETGHFAHAGITESSPHPIPEVTYHRVMDLPLRLLVSANLSLNHYQSSCHAVQPCPCPSSVAANSWNPRWKASNYQMDVQTRENYRTLR